MGTHRKRVHSKRGRCKGNTHICLYRITVNHRTWTVMAQYFCSLAYRIQGACLIVYQHQGGKDHRSICSLFQIIQIQRAASGGDAHNGKPIPLQLRRCVFYRRMLSVRDEDLPSAAVFYRPAFCIYRSKNRLIVCFRAAGTKTNLSVSGPPQAQRGGHLPPGFLQHPVGCHSRPMNRTGICKAYTQGFPHFLQGSL